ncbi:MAG: TrmB family transcriptional regulator [Salinirussus sp.]
MSDVPPQRRAVEDLQQVGLKEYEAKCFVALTQMTDGTARSISERIDIPRTRVYEAARVLEERGLIQVQHSSPKRYRAIDYDEAVEVFRSRYESRFEELEGTLASLDAETDPSADSDSREVWSLTDRSAIQSRTRTLLDDATGEVVLVVGDDRVISGGLLDALQVAADRDVDVIVGAGTEDIRDVLGDAVQGVEAFESTLPWLQAGSAVPAVG